MKKGNFIDMIVPILLVYGVSTFLNTKYSLFKVGILVIYMVVTDIAIGLIANRSQREKTKRNYQAIELFKVWVSITISVVVPTFGVASIIGLSNQDFFLITMIYISGLLFMATLLRAGIEIDAKYPLFLGKRRKY